MKRVAIVTGGARGIGLAMARALGKSGHAVVIASRTQAQLDAATASLEGEGIAVVAKATDVSRVEQCDALVAEALRACGRVDVLVNNAGVNGWIGLVDGCEPAEWRQAIEVNLFGSLYCARACLPAMKRQGGGKIVNVAGGGVGGNGVAPRVSAYTTSKAAVAQLTESLAREVADDNVQVNCISPGAVVTEMTAAVVAAGPERAGKELYERTLAQRNAGGESPELAANLVAWLASEKSGKLTGKLLSAKWDDVTKMDLEATNRAPVYVLRRIDGVMFGEIKK
jgi:NAD(P)-dependent dehydrogenase (short-subunit alcohol dehydrogenase family)